MDVSTGRLELCLQLQKFFSAIQRRNHFVGGAHETLLSLVEAHLLVEIDGNGRLRPSQISKQLRLNAVTTFRTLSRLVEQGLLTEQADPSDGRGKSFSLTDKGRSILDYFDKKANDSTAVIADRLNAGQRIEFGEFVSQMADRLGVEPSVSRPIDNPLRPPIRRITRALGLLGGAEYGDVSLSSLEWFTLQEAEADADGVLPSIVADKFFVPRSTMTGVVNRLVKLRVLARQEGAAGSDRRQAPFTLTKAGSNALREIERKKAELIARGVEGLTESRLEKFARLTALMASSKSDPINRDVVLQPQIVARALDSESTRREAREYLLEQLVRFAWHKSAPSEIVAETSKVFGLYCEATLSGVCEIEPTPSGGVLKNFIVDSALISSGLCQKFLESCRALLSGDQELKVTADTYVSRAIEKFTGRADALVRDSSEELKEMWESA